MTKDPGKWTAVSLRPMFGTAKPVALPTVVPKETRECELFWVDALVRNDSDIQSLDPEIESCADDSHGKSDVILRSQEGDEIGIQVTELTYELRREREFQRTQFLRKNLEHFVCEKVSAQKKLMVKCFLPYVSTRKYHAPKPEDVLDATIAFIEGSDEEDLVEVPSARIYFKWVDDGELFVPSVGNIGIDCNLDALPRSLEIYHDAILNLCNKKEKSKSPWLLIWSTTFWKDKHWIGDEVLDQMRSALDPLDFERVYFLETLDMPGAFQKNLTVHMIKGQEL